MNSQLLRYTDTKATRSKADNRGSAVTKLYRWRVARERVCVNESTSPWEPMSEWLKACGSAHEPRWGSMSRPRSIWRAFSIQTLISAKLQQAVAPSAFLSCSSFVFTLHIIPLPGCDKSEAPLAPLSLSLSHGSKLEIEPPWWTINCREFFLLRKSSREGKVTPKKRERKMVTAKMHGLSESLIVAHQHHINHWITATSLDLMPGVNHSITFEN